MYPLENAIMMHMGNLIPLPPDDALYQVQGQISLLFGGVLSFGLAHYSSSEFELFAEELLMSDSMIRVTNNLVHSFYAVLPKFLCILVCSFRWS